MGSVPAIASTPAPEGEIPAEDAKKKAWEEFMRNIFVGTILFPRAGTPLAEAEDQRNEDNV
ncbi:hypothetical protein WJ69_34170 [Burkholderia ubonensis]|nr:hypothetical protein WJ69_34170 [Burkholderia ubonensis]